MGPQEHKVERRLAAIFAADVAGYSRLMSQDEVGTLRTLAAQRRVMDQLIAEHGGRIANTAGDSVLAEFPSAVEAVQCAVAVQDELAATDVPDGHQVQFRIGIHVGDVIVREGDLFGDAVNITARLQSLAEPSGICLSGAAHDCVRKILPLGFDDRGLHLVKNVAEPVQMFGLRRSRLRSLPRPQPLPLPDKPSIAVLPFAAASAEDEYLADGIADDIITALSKMRWLFVIGRNSSFAYKGRAISVTEIARQLGVVYVVTGSTRRSGSRIRVSAQLVEGDTGGAIWAERYDRDLSDVLILQDEIAEQIAGAIEPELLKREGQRAAERPLQDLTAWDMVRRGVWEFHKFTPTSLRVARDLFRKVIAIAPNAADGYLWLGRVSGGLVSYDWTDDPDATLREGMAAALHAVQLDDRSPYAHYAVAVTHTFGGVLEPAIRAAERAVSLSPSFALGYLILGVAHLFSGRANQALEALEHGLRLSPSDPNNLNWFLYAAVACCFTGQPERGLTFARRSLELRPHWACALKIVVLCCRAIGDERQAQLALDEMQSVGDTQSDLTRFISKFNPAWGAKIERAITECDVGQPEAEPELHETPRDLA
jgi:adenylate cyclase